METNEWKEIEPNKREEFLHIVRVLNKYYDSQNDNSKDKSANFRKELEQQDSKSIRVYLKKFGNYEYLVHAELKSISKRIPNKDTWIHIDGIREERDSLKKKGIADHPVFQIRGLSDIYEEGTRLTKRRNLPK
ncbi:MAG: hypothetical protein JJT78_02810 [Leptospira sp.]|nr:hypothetical protein [Leptospira sp.]